MHELHTVKGLTKMEGNMFINNSNTSLFTDGLTARVKRYVERTKPV